MIHIGKQIKKELSRQQRSIQWLATKICCDRTNVYKIFKRESIDTGLLLRISMVLNKDFFEYYSKEFYRDKDRKIVTDSKMDEDDEYCINDAV